MDDGSVFLTKGSRVRVRRIVANDPPSSLSGMQMKIGVSIQEATGVVTHVYGYANTKAEYDRGEFFKRTVVVKPDDGGPEVEWDQKHLVEVLP